MQCDCSGSRLLSNTGRFGKLFMLVSKCDCLAKDFYRFLEIVDDTGGSSNRLSFHGELVAGFMDRFALCQLPSIDLCCDPGQANELYF